MIKEIAKHTWLLAVVALLYYGIVPIVTSWIDSYTQIEITRIVTASTKDSTKVAYGIVTNEIVEKAGGTE